MKSKYDVAIPITGSIWVKVIADSEEQAIEFALQSPDLCLDNIEEWEAHKQIMTDNVLNTHIVNAYAIRIKE